MTAWTSTIGDTVGAVDSGTNTQPFRDLLGLVDSASWVQVVAPSWAATINDTVGLVDSGTNVYSTGDWVGLVDSMTAVATTGNGLSSEPLGVGDTNTDFTHNVTDTFADTNSIFDSIVAALTTSSGVNYTTSVNDTVGTLDSSTSLKFIDATFTDRVDAGDPLAFDYVPLATWNVNLSDVLGLLDDNVAHEPIQATTLLLTLGPVTLGWNVDPSKVEIE